MQDTSKRGITSSLKMMVDQNHVLIINKNINMNLRPAEQEHFLPYRRTGTDFNIY